MSEIIELSTLEKLILHLEENGVKKNWLARKMDRTESWVSKVLNGTIPITDDLKGRLEDVLKTKF